MGHCIAGTWTSEDHFPTDETGAFVRQETTFRDRVTADGSSGFAVEAGRYHLYVSYACPWAHRTLIARSILGLEEAIPVSVAHPLMLENGWVFSNAGFDYLWQLYVQADETYTGRATVPVLWDEQENTIVNNDSRDILRMFTTELRALWRRPLELAPHDILGQIDEVITANYAPINDGVYRAGFARTQQAYEEAARSVFEALDRWEVVLGTQRYLCGDRFTEADICLFTTLLRFDPVYYSHFKCNLRRIFDYPNLSGYVRDIYQQPGVAQTCRLDHIKRHYYGSHASINPTGIVPIGPAPEWWTQPHDRARPS